MARLSKALVKDIVKASQAAAAIMQSQYGSIDLIEQPKYREDWLALYKVHVWVNACIFAKATTMAKLDYGIYEVDRKTKELTRMDEHPLLFLLDYPNPQTTYYDWMEKTIIHLELTGNSYSEIVYGTEEVRVGKAKDPVSRTTLPIELWVVRPDYLTPIPKKTGDLDYWKFQVRKFANTRRLEVDEVLPFTYTDPTDPLFGMPNGQAAINDIRQDNAMAAWNLDFFKDSLMPQGVFTTDKALQPWEAKEVATQIRDYLIGEGRKVLVLGKNLKWEMTSTNPKDVDFHTGRDENRQSILAAYGVPPVKVGLLEHAKYDNYGLQTEAFHRDTILPITRKVEGGLNLFLLPRYPDLQRTLEKDYLFKLDTDELLAEDQSRVTDRVIKVFDRGLLTVNEALEELGKEAVEDEAIGNMRFIDSRLVPFDLAVNPPEEGMNSLATETGDELVKNMRSLEDHIDKEVLEKVSEAVARIKEAE